MATTKFARVINVSDVKSGKNGNYRTIKLETVAQDVIKHPVLGMITVTKPVQFGTINQWETNINGTKDPLFDAKVGDFVMGDVVSRKVPAYQITDQKTGEIRTVETASRVVLGDSSDETSWEVLCDRAFRSFYSNQPSQEVNLLVSDPQV